MTVEESSESVIEACANMHKPCGGAVVEPQWYVAIVRPRYERICRDKIASMGFDTYIASQKTINVYSSRNKHVVEKIVIPKTVFVKLNNEKDRLDVLKGCLYVDRFLINTSSKDRSFAVIPNVQLEKLKFMLYESDSPVAFTSSPLNLGDTVRVLRGPLTGIEGRICRLGSNSYIVIEIGKLGSAMTYISSTDIEKVD